MKSAATILAAAILITLALTDPARAAAEPPTDITERIIEANALIQRKQYREAVELLSKIIRGLPVDSPEVPRLLGRLRLACEEAWAGQRFVQEVQRQQKRVEFGEFDAETRRTLRRTFLLQLGNYYYDHRQSIGAIRTYEKVLELNAEEDAALVADRLAELYEEAGHLREALVLRRDQLGRAPGSERLRRKVAELHFKLGELDEGLQLVGEPENAGALQLARQLQRAGYLPEAEELVRRVSGENPEAQRLLARLLCDQKEFREALQVLQRAFVLQDGNEKSTREMFELASEMAQVHMHNGTLARAVTETEGEFDRLSQGEHAKRRKLLALLCELHRQDQNPTAALEALLQFSDLVQEPRQVRWRLTRLAREALQHLIAQNRYAEADQLMQKLRGRTEEQTWLECAHYVTLIRSGRNDEAAELLGQLEREAGADESRLYSLVSEFELWNEDELCTRFARKILEARPHNSVYDANAHVRLAQHLYAREEFEEALEHFDAVDASLGQRGMALLNEEHWRRLELHARYRAAGDDPDVLVRILADPRPVRSKVAANLLGRFGRPEHVPALEKQVADAPPPLQAALREAITMIRARHAEAPPQPEPISEQELPERLAAEGEVLWIREDPHRPDTRWAALEGRFLISADLRRGRLDRHADAVEFLAGRVPQVSDVAFTEENVWVGTDHGLFVFSRDRGRWSAYAVNREFVDVPVVELRAGPQGIWLRIRLEGAERAFRFDPGTGQWRED